jgi:predicted Zn-dependent peptidase
MPNTGLIFIIQALLYFQLMLFSNELIASKYSPPGLYDVETVTLDNGMDVILKQRKAAHTFSMRVWVGVGTQDFSCEQQEIPHFLEHLLFTGTSKHSEAELEHLVTDHGGYWNATTGVEQTTYQMDIYSRYADFAIEMLHEIITDSSITPENVELSRDIIHRESGGEPSVIRQWFRERGFGVNATIKAVRQLVPDTNLVCEKLVTATDISRDQIIDTYEKYYVPGNMALIIVGDFDRNKVIQQIRGTFGSIPAAQIPERIKTGNKESKSFDPVTGTFAPFLSDDANIGIMYRLPGYWSDDHYPMMVLEEYLHYKVSEVIRIQRGLAYAPDTWSYRTDQFGLFGVYADVDIDDIEDALFLINREMKSLTEHYLSEELLEKSKLKILLRSVQGYESNSEFADYYSTQYVLFKKARSFENVEQKIESVTYDDIERVIKEYLSDDKAVTIYETPTLTYSQLYLLLSLLLLIIIMTVFVSYIRVHGHLKNKLK